MRTVKNLDDFAGMLVFDQWTCNCDSRQVVFHSVEAEESYEPHGFRATMIDQGFCFHGNQWNFPDSSRRGLFAHSSAYSSITGMKSFEPWIQRVETLRDEFLEEAARAVPVEWYEGGTAELVSLVATLGERRGLVRNLVQECVRSSANYFLNWEG
jgi:hypothetical protein